LHLSAKTSESLPSIFPNMAPCHTEYFQLKTSEKTAEAGRSEDDLPEGHPLKTLM
jgi:hypothetical protein